MVLRINCGQVVVSAVGAENQSGEVGAPTSRISDNPFSGDCLQIPTARYALTDGVTELSTTYGRQKAGVH